MTKFGFICFHFNSAIVVIAVLFLHIYVNDVRNEHLSHYDDGIFHLHMFLHMFSTDLSFI